MSDISHSSMISVIIPTYNRADCIDEALESVFLQTHSNYEIIVVDDGSTDNTKEVLEPYLDKIKYIYQENSGVATARNTGIRQANGQLIAFLDSDDKWLPDKLKIQLQCVIRNNVKACFTNYNLSEGTSISEERIRQAVMEKKYKDALELMLLEPAGLFLQTLLIEKQLLEEIGCFREDLTVSEDTHFIYELALKVPLAFIFDPLVIIDRHPNRKRLTDNSINARRLRNEAHISILSSVLSRYSGRDPQVVTRLKYKLGYALSRRAEIACFDRDYPKAKRLATEALRIGGDMRIYLRSLIVKLYPQYIARRYERIFEQTTQQ